MVLQHHRHKPPRGGRVVPGRNLRLAARIKWIAVWPFRRNKCPAANGARLDGRPVVVVEPSAGARCEPERCRQPGARDGLICSLCSVRCPRRQLGNCYPVDMPGAPR
jgi:hypothetical protein